MMTKILSILAVFTGACSTAPTVIMRADGTRIANLGTSLLEKSQSEAALVTMADGTRIEYAKIGKDQTNVANMAIGTWGTVAGIKELAAGMNQGEAIREVNQTRRAGQAANLSRARSADAVKIKTFVPPLP
jgi:hypothetical protein